MAPDVRQEGERERKKSPPVAFKRFSCDNSMFPAVVLILICSVSSLSTISPPGTATYSTAPFTDQKPGTSGLRKKTTKFLDTPNYLENFVQSILDARDSGAPLLVCGDGRYGTSTAIDRICSVLAGNGISKIYVPSGGIMSTPAASSFIRSRGNDCEGGILLTASHNPGGPQGDFGIKVSVCSVVVSLQCRCELVICVVDSRWQVADSRQ